MRNSSGEERYYVVKYNVSLGVKYNVGPGAGLGSGLESGSGSGPESGSRPVLVAGPGSIIRGTQLVKKDITSSNIMLAWDQVWQQTYNQVGGQIWEQIGQHIRDQLYKLG